MSDTQIQTSAATKLNDTSVIAAKTADDTLWLYIFLEFALLLGVCFELAIHEWLAAAGTLMIMAILYLSARYDCLATGQRVSDLRAPSVGSEGVNCD